MKLTTGLLNYTGTPGAYTNTFANRPGATAVPTGTLYFSNDTNILYQTNGSSWISYSGGGGSQDLASVLAINNAASNTIILYSPSGAYNPQLEYEGYKVGNGSVELFWGLSQEEISFKYNGGALFGLAIDFRNTTRTTYLGDCGQVGNGTELWVNDVQFNIKTFKNRAVNAQGTGIKIDFFNRVYSYGDWFGYDDGNYIEVDDNAGNFNINCDGYTYVNSGTLSLNGNGPANASIDFNNSAFLSGTAGSNSGNHLVIYVQGVQYKIELKNP